MTIRFIGDVHGKYNQYKHIIKDCKDSIQVGDMGVGFLSVRQGELKKLPNPPFDRMKEGNHRFIRGNHDNPQHCLNHPQCIDDGHSEEIEGHKFYFLGGAFSIDRAHRTEGLDWWEDEELSMKRLQVEIDNYKEIKPDVVVTHDCPESIALQMMDVLRISDKTRFPSRTRVALDEMFFHHQPKFWIFGHWHKTMRFTQMGTEFNCLGELEYMDLELDNLIGTGIISLEE